jgi:hypothetical protein
MLLFILSHGSKSRQPLLLALQIVGITATIRTKMVMVMEGLEALATDGAVYVHRRHILRLIPTGAGL